CSAGSPAGFAFNVSVGEPPVVPLAVTVSHAWSEETFQLAETPAFSDTVTVRVRFVVFTDAVLANATPSDETRSRRGSRLSVTGRVRSTLFEPSWRLTVVDETPDASARRLGLTLNDPAPVPLPPVTPSQESLGVAVQATLSPVTFTCCAGGSLGCPATAEK